MDSHLINNQEENVVNDIFLESPFLPDIFPMEPPRSKPSYLDLATLNSQMEHLSLTVNTQSLRIEVERAKRQKMRATIKQLRREMNNPCSEIASLRQEVSTIYENQNTNSYYLDGELTRINSMSFRCFARMYVSMYPFSLMFPYLLINVLR